MSKSKFVVSSNGFFFDCETCVLYMGYRFSVKASAMTGDEYDLYSNLRKQFPDLKVKIVEPKKRRVVYIPYERIVQYIAYQENAVELMATFNKVKEEASSKRNPRKFVDDWFRATFPQFGQYPKVS